jgi:hypothetical protein
MQLMVVSAETTEGDEEETIDEGNPVQMWRRAPPSVTPPLHSSGLLPSYIMAVLLHLRILQHQIDI